jgi:stearoyl-CoA desaturase (delta-9 desaturase)
LSCRQLAHRSFQTPKWLEYALSYCGVLAVEGDPIEWVSAHRYHHLHCDTPLDPHSPYEGFFWSHMGWLFSTEASMLDYANADDLKSQWFYR